MTPSETQQPLAAGNDDGHTDIVHTHDVATVPAKTVESSEASDLKIRTNSLGEVILGVKCDQCR